MEGIKGLTGFGAEPDDPDFFFLFRSGTEKEMTTVFELRSFSIFALILNIFLRFYFFVNNVIKRGQGRSADERSSEISIYCISG